MKVKGAGDDGVKPQLLPATSYPEIRLRFLLRKSPTQSQRESLRMAEQVSFVPMEAVGENGGINLDVIRNKEDVSTGYTLFFDGDVVVAKITPCFENCKGAMVSGLHGGVGFGTTELHVLSAAERLDAGFLFYLTISHSFRIQGEAAMKGAAGQKRVSDEFIQDFRFRLPSLAEQRQIKCYLDAETAQMDALMVEKERMLALLEEKRAALVSHAVTRGLNARAKLKPSGLRWLGDIPAHWEMKRLKFLISGLTQGWSPQASNVPATESEVGVLKLSAVSKGQFIPDENKALMPDEEYPAELAIKRGDLLVSRSNTPGLVGDACAVPADFPNLLIPDLIYRLRVHTEVADSEYLAAFLLTPIARTQIRGDARGSSGTMVKVGQEHIQNWRIPVPPLAEQRAIVAMIAEERGRTAVFREALERSIALLKERRSALITAAVTGQITVPGGGKPTKHETTHEN